MPENKLRSKILLLCLVLLFGAGKVWSQVIFVDTTATGANTGLSWTDAYTNLQSAFAVMGAGDSVFVAEGTYAPTNGTSRTASFAMVDSAKVFGGFPSGGSSFAARDWNLNRTNLTGDIGVVGDSTDNSYHVMEALSVSEATEINGFWIWEGNADGSSTNDQGGGLYAIGSRIIIRNCMFIENYAIFRGGAASIRTERVVFENCGFVRNNCDSRGGGIASRNGADVQVINSVLYANTTVGVGGGVEASGGGATLNFVNSILWANSPDQIFGAVTATYSNIQGTYPGTGNLDLNPQFIDADSADFRIGLCSPMVDQGLDSVAPPIDFYGGSRPFDGDGDLTATTDIGMHETQAIGSPPLVTFFGLQPIQCLNQSALTLTGSESPGGTFSIDPPSAAFTDNGNGTATFDPSAAGQDTFLIVYSFTDTNACFGADSQQVIVNAAPVVSLNPTATQQFCDGDSVLISGSPAGGGNQWYLNGVPLAGETADSLFAKQAGVHNLLKTIDGCSDSAATGVTVIIDPAPTVTITPPGPDTVCPGGTRLLTVSGGSNFQWTFNGDTIVGATASTFTADSTGWYNAWITGGNTCADTAAVGHFLFEGDVEAPLTICRDTTLYLDGAGLAGITAADLDLGSTDNCGIDTIFLSTYAFTCADTGTNAVTLSVQDSLGNIGTCISTVSVWDTLHPVALCQPLTFYLDVSGSASLSAAQVDNGSNDNCSVDTLILSQSAFVCADTGSFSLTLTVIDPSGNRDSCQSSVSLLDTLAPLAFCHDTLIFLDPGGNASLTANDLDSLSSDNCGIQSFSISQTAFTCADVGQNAITLTVRDVSGNQGTCLSQVTVGDTVFPTAACQDITFFLGAGGTGLLQGVELDAGSADNCGIDTLIASPDFFTCADTGTNTVTLYALDAFGNADSCFNTVTVTDSFPVVAGCVDTTVYLDNSGSVTVSAAVIGGASTGNCGIDSLYLSDSIFTCADRGLNSVQLTVVAFGGASTSCTANITVEDTLPPTALCKDTTVAVGLSGNFSFIPADLDNGSIDNCGIAQWTLDDSTFNCGQTGILAILTAIDSAGNSDTCHASISIIDTLPPKAFCRAGTETLDQSFSTFDSQEGGRGFAQSFQPALSGYLTRIRFFSQSLNSNDSATVEIRTGTDPNAGTVLGSDRVPINTGAFQTIDASFASLPVLNAGSPYVFRVVGDNASNTILGRAQSSGGYPNGNASSFNGTNWLSSSRDLRFEQYVLPLGQGGDTVYLGGAGTVSIDTSFIDQGSFDNCGLDSAWLNLTGFTCADTGIQWVVLTVSDRDGNLDSCQATILVRDTLSPNALCHDTTLFLNAAGLVGLLTSDLDDGSNDNCAIDTLFASQTAFTCSDTGITSVTLTVVDVSGNLASCQANVTVLDSTFPIMACQDDTLALGFSGTAQASIAGTDNGSSDNCSLDTLFLRNRDFGCADLGLNTTYLIGEDASGNIDSCLVNILVRDQTGPTAVCQNLTIYLDAVGNAGTTASNADGGSTDACGINSFSLSDSVFSCGQIGPNPEVLTITDVNGNASTCPVQITVLDTVRPLANCQNLTLNLSAAGTASFNVADMNAGSSDICGIDSIWVSQDSFSCREIGVNPIILSVRDNSGNIGTCTGMVTVQDTAGITVRPVSLGPDSIQCGNDTVLLNAGAGFDGYNWNTGDTTALIAVADTGNYIVIVNDEFGCTGTDTVRLVPGIFPGNFISVIGNNILCAGDSVVLDAGPNFTAYSWSTGASSQTITVMASGTYSVSAMDSTGCSNTDSEQVTFEPFPTPNPIITPSGPVDLCLGDTLVLDAGNGYFSYLWSTGSSAQTLNVTAGGTYTVTVFNGAGCSSTADSVLVNPLPAPAVPVITNSGDTLFSSSGLVYQWYLNGTALIGATQSFYVPTVSGFYQVQTTDPNGCQAISANFTFIVSIPESGFSSLRVWPNPAGDRVKIKVKGEALGRVNVRLLDLQGREILTTSSGSQGNSWQDELDLSGVAKGFYLMEIEAGDSRQMVRLVRK